MDRRRFIQAGAGAAAFLAARKQVLGQQGLPLPGKAIPQFVDALPTLHITSATVVELQMQEFLSPVMPTGFVPATGGPYAGTYVWGYKDAKGQTATSYIGPVILATRGVPTQIKYVNNLGNTAGSQVAAWKYSTDQTLHWADPLGTGMSFDNYAGPIPAVPHLHGGEVPPQIDGGPDAWFTSDGSYIGHAYYSRDGAGAKNYAIYRYPNTQEAANIWFHDHVLGITRLNVYAGLAGAYLIKDNALTLPAGLTPYGLDMEIIIPLVIQDRMFDVNGQLYFPNVGINPEHPFWLPEFEGDVIVVNGKAWPFLSVQPKRYRFLFLNGSNARTYEMFLQSALPTAPLLWVIGTDGGYLDAPVPVQKLLMMPGERYDVIIDFAGYQNQSLTLRNTGRTPFPKGAPPHGSTIGRIMQFRVGPGPVTDTSYNPASGIPLRPPMIRLVNPATGTPGAGVTVHKTRQLTLNEVMGPGGPVEVLVNNTMWDGLSVATDVYPGGLRPDFTRVLPSNEEYFSELPAEGQTELWEIINLTADAHPIHLHLVQFQLMNRQNFNFNKYNTAYNALFPGSAALDPMTGLPHPPGVFIGGFGPPLPYTTANADGAVGGNPAITPYLQGPVNPPETWERGWKDTVIAYPGEVTRIMVRWAPTDLLTTAPAAQLHYPFDPNSGHGYVWHCHIIDHEDNEMMRPDSVTLNPAAPAPGARPLKMGTDY